MYIYIYIIKFHFLDVFEKCKNIVLNMLIYTVVYPESYKKKQR